MSIEGSAGAETIVAGHPIAGGVAPAGPPAPPTPWSWRATILLAICAVGGAAYVLQTAVGTRGQAVAGVFCFFGIVALFSTNLRALSWRTAGWGNGIQIA